MWFNEPLARLLGVGADEWSLARFEALCDPQDFARLAEQARAVVSGSESTFAATCRVRRESGEARTLWTWAVLVRDSAGAVQRIQGYVRDETVERRASKLTHDFNNLLAIISTSLSIADLQLERERHAQARVTLAAASSAVERAVNLLRQSRGSEQKRPVDLNALVTAVGQSEPELLTRLAPRLPLLLGDEAGLQQLIKSLVRNVRQVAEQVVLETAAESGAVLVQVGAVGEAGSPGSAPLDAAGLEIMKAHQAVLAQRGAQFTLRFPVAGAMNLRVLMVDDEQIVRRGAARLLAHCGCTVEEAENGQQALELVSASSQPFDLVMMDVTMPVLDGVAAAREMRARWPSMAVVLSSGLSDPEYTLPEGVRFLPKPWSRAALETLLRELPAR